VIDRVILVVTHRSIVDSYSVASFWGEENLLPMIDTDFFCSIFWHQPHARKLSALSSVILNSIPRLPCRGFFSFILAVLCTFLISGLAHLVIDVSAGVSADHSGALLFFFLQAVGIFIEVGIGGVLSSNRQTE
jgi:hypothetical protein